MAESFWGLRLFLAVVSFSFIKSTLRAESFCELGILSSALVTFSVMDSFFFSEFVLLDLSDISLITSVLGSKFSSIKKLVIHPLV